jgi:hypothetical protein
MVSQIAIWASTPESIFFDVRIKPADLCVAEGSLPQCGKRFLVF